MASTTIKVATVSGETIESTAREAHRAAGRTFRGLVSGERLAPLAKGAGTYLRACVGGARRDAIGTLDTVNGRPGAKATREDRIAWYLASDATDACEPSAE